MMGVLRKVTPSFLLSRYHLLLAFAGALLYGFPSYSMVVIGVTGTNGKSTTVDMISRILKEAGFKTASLSSIRFQVGEQEERNKLKMTMPGRFAIQQFLKEAKDKGCTHVVLEVTSEGILQHRHRFIDFDAAVFTNLSPEHIERHGSFENYKAAKGKLFAAVKKVHVINGDDEHAGFFLSFPAENTVTYSFGKGDVEGKELRSNERGVSFSLEGTVISLPLLGAFNASNALGAIATVKTQGISVATAKEALAKIDKVPGRMEEVVSSPFRVIVDYAFTPAALELVYQTLKTGNKLICVLGAAGGGRDRWKRPVLGKIASKHCNTVIITNEDPYQEDPVQIMKEVAEGTNGKATIIEDRREAVAAALRVAKSGDTVVITGKGSEDSIAQKGKKIPWDDREVAREEFGEIKREPL